MEIRIGERVVNDVPPKERDIAMVFQNYALYPHLTVRENMAFSMRIRGAPRSEIDQRVNRAATILGLTQLLDRYPRQLSGGQRQRVAMGRAIVRDPQVFLFDEPLSNLDAKLRVAMRTEIKALHQRLKTTTIYVTHDQIEAMTMADRIVVMHDGVVEQIGPPLELYDRPDNLFVAGFIGSPAMNFVPGKVRANGHLVFATETGLTIPLTGAPAGTEGRPLILGIRPEHFDLAPDGMEAEVVVVEPTGSETMLAVRAGGQDLTCVLRERVTERPGETVSCAPTACISSTPRPAAPAGLTCAGAERPQRRSPREKPGCPFSTAVPCLPAPPRPASPRAATSSASRRPGRRPASGSRTGGESLAPALEAIRPGRGRGLHEDGGSLHPGNGGEGHGQQRILRRHPAQGFGRRQYRPGPGHGVGPVLVPRPLPRQMPGGRGRGGVACQEIRAVVPSAEAYGKVKGKWIAIPVAFNGGYPNYRISAMKKAGFDKFPTDTAGFLELCRGLKKNNTPAGFALGHATGDGNTWCHWALWSHGANLVDANEKIVINSPETAKALEYVKSLYETFVPGTVSWNDSSNNKAFLAGDLYLTNNGISIYAAAKKDNPKLAEDMDHAVWPIGPAASRPSSSSPSRSWPSSIRRRPMPARRSWPS